MLCKGALLPEAIGGNTFNDGWFELQLLNTKILLLSVSAILFGSLSPILSNVGCTSKFLFKLNLNTLFPLGSAAIRVLLSLVISISPSERTGKTIEVRLPLTSNRMIFDESEGGSSEKYETKKKSLVIASPTGLKLGLSVISITRSGAILPEAVSPNILILGLMEPLFRNRLPWLNTKSELLPLVSISIGVLIPVKLPAITLGEFREIIPFPRFNSNLNISSFSVPAETSTISPEEGALVHPYVVTKSIAAARTRKYLQFIFIISPVPFF
jgi:hypothetical protein